jgi:hypothetical protein
VYAGSEKEVITWLNGIIRVTDLFSGLSIACNNILEAASDWPISASATAALAQQIYIEPLPGYSCCDAPQQAGSEDELENLQKASPNSTSL